MILRLLPKGSTCKPKVSSVGAATACRCALNISPVKTSAKLVLPGGASPETAADIAPFTAGEAVGVVKKLKFASMG